MGLLKTMLITLAVLAIVAGLMSTLAMSVFFLAGMANSKPEQARQITMLIWTMVIVGVMCAIAAGALTWQSKPGMAAIVGLLPVLFDVGLFIVCMWLEI